MAKVGRVHALPDFKQLKKWHCMDQQSVTLIKKYIAQKKNILIIGGKNAGKDTVMHAIANYSYQLHQSPAVLPLGEKVNLKNVFKTATWKKQKNILVNKHHTIAEIGYTGKCEDLYPYITKMGKGFDIVLDLRNLGKTRTICQIFEKKNNLWTTPYFNMPYFDTLKGKFAG